MQYPNEYTIARSAQKCRARCVTTHPTPWHQLQPRWREKKWNRFGVTGRDYAAGVESHNAAKELCLIPLVSLLCWSPCCLQGWLQTESTFGSLSQALNSTSYLSPKHTALLWIHHMAQDFLLTLLLKAEKPQPEPFTYFSCPNLNV